jgi:hypothetical protein
MFIVIALLLMLTELTAFAASKAPLAIVQDFQGEVVVFRNPVRHKSPEFDRRVEAQVHQASFYLGWYWEAYPVRNSTQLFYGDLISTGAGSSARVRVQSLHEIRLSEKSVVQFVPNFMSLLLAQVANPTVYVIAGKLRIKVNPDANFRSFTARTSSMAMDLRKADLLVSVKGKMTQVLGLDGDFSVRRVSRESQQSYSQSLDQYRGRNFRELSRLTAIRKNQLEERILELKAGSKAESWEALNQKDLNNLNRVLGAEKTRSYLDTADRFEAVAIRNEDLDFYADLLPDLETVMEMMEFANISEGDMQEGLDPAADSQAIVYEQSQEMPQMEPDAPLFNFFSIHLGYVNSLNNFNGRHSFEARSLALELEMRPFRYVYTYLTFSNGVADTKDMANFLGEGPPQTLNSYSQLAGGVGARAVLWKNLSLSIGAGIINIQNLSIQYEDLPANVNRTYTISLDPIPVAELGMSVNFVGNLELFLRYGLGSSFATIEAKDIADNYKSSGSFSYGTLGLGWNAQ